MKIAIGFSIELARGTQAQKHIDDALVDCSALFLARAKELLAARAEEAAAAVLAAATGAMALTRGMASTRPS